MNPNYATRVGNTVGRLFLTRTGEHLFKNTNREILMKSSFSKEPRPKGGALKTPKTIPTGKPDVLRADGTEYIS
jgi:hypothetical protein